MAETLVSPGVLARETDQSFVTAQPVQAGAAIIGPTVKGPVEIPTLVTSYSDYQNKFGTTFVSGGDVYSFLTSISAYNYFNNGGTSLLISRVVSASNTWNYAEAIPTAGTTVGLATASGEFDVVTTSFDANGEEFRLTYAGTTYRFQAVDYVAEDDEDGYLYYFTSSATAATANNNLKNAINNSAFGSLGIVVATTSSATLILSASDSGTAYNGIVGTTGSSDVGFSTQVTLAGGTNTTSETTVFTLETIGKGAIWNNTSSIDASGSLGSGSADNIRWEIQNANTSSGTFALIIRRGDDNENNKNPLETWTNLSLDPTQNNYISKVIGDQTLRYNSTNNYIEVSGSYPNASNYVRVKSVALNTPYYFDNTGVAKDIYTGSLPSNGSGSYGGSFSGGIGNIAPANAKFYDQISNTNSQGLSGSDYTSMVNLMSNQDNYQFNIITVPGLIDAFATNRSVITSVINNTQMRGDSIAVIDEVGYGSSVATVSSQASSRDTSYAATYWPWVQLIDPDSAKNVWVPASTVIPGVYAFTDKASAPWFAPAGINRGGLSVIRAEQQLSQTQRDTLYDNKVNPIAQFPGVGTVVYGQKTLQTKASALDRVNVRRLLINLKSYISQVANTLVFEQNTRTTRNQFLNAVNPYLESVQQRQGLYAFRVIMDDTNNTADVIDRNQLVGQIYIQPTRTAEFIYLDFNILPTGATFPA